MAEVKWIKIVTDVFDDEKILMIESLPECDSIIVIWFKLLCLAGKQNNCGVFQMGRMPYTDEMFATIFRRPLNTIRLALSTFEKFGMIEIINETVTIPNWDKHQSLDAYEKKKERDRLYQSERRAAQKALIEKSSNNRLTVERQSSDESSSVAFSEKIRQKKEKEGDEEENNTPPAAPSDSASTIASEEFEWLWSQYPRKEGKKAAFASYQRAKKKGVFFDDVRAGLLNYLDYIKAKKIEHQFIKQGSTWFNGEHWNDEYDYSAPESSPAQQTSSNPFLDLMINGDET